MVYTRDLEGNFTSVNNTLVRVLGYTRAGAAAHEYCSRSSLLSTISWCARQWERTKEGEASGDAELEVITKYGARVAVEIRSRLLYEDGKVVGVQGIARNVTERKQVEQQVVLQAAALKAAAVGIVITDRHGTFFGSTPPSRPCRATPGRRLSARIHFCSQPEAHDSELYREMWNTVQSGRVWRGDILTRRKDGALYNEELTITPVYGTPGEVTHFVAIGQDISPRKQAEEARAQLAAIVESSNDAIEGLTTTGTIVSWNRGAEVLYGYPPEEIVGKHVSTLAPADLSDELCQLLERVRQGETVTNFETARVTKDGRRIAVSVSMAPLRNSRGEVVGTSTIARDITQRLEAEEALRYSEEKYRSIVMNIPDVVWTIDTLGRFAFISPNIERLSGYKAEEVLAGGLDLLFATMHPDDVQGIEASLKAALRDPHPCEAEYRGRCKDGRWIWVRARAIGAYEKDGVQYLQGLLSDITERKNAEQALQESQSRLQAIVDSVQTGIVMIDPETHRIADVNPVALKLIGARAIPRGGRRMPPIHLSGGAGPLPGLGFGPHGGQLRARSPDRLRRAPRHYQDRSSRRHRRT